MSETELLLAAEAGDVAAVGALLAAGAQVDYASASGDTALMRATSKGRLDVVRLLLDAGADVNARRADGMTPLIYAAFFGHADVVRCLIDSGADLNASDRLGMRALDWAKSKGAGDTVKILQGGAAPEGRPSTTYHEAEQEIRSEEILDQRSAHPLAAGPLSPNSGPEMEDCAADDTSRKIHTQTQTITLFHYACFVLSLIIIFATLTWVFFKKD
jgi:hypothetical protein